MDHSVSSVGSRLCEVGSMARAREPASERSVGAGSAGDAGHSRPGGRPRDSALDEAIILAARGRLVKDGYWGMTIGEIGGDGGVNRPTLYRPWKKKLHQAGER